MSVEGIKRAAESRPYRLERRYSNGCEVCPEIWLGQHWVATLAGAPYLGHSSLQAGRRIVAALNATRHMTIEELERGALCLKPEGGS